MSVEEKINRVPVYQLCPEMTIRLNSRQILQPSWRPRFPTATPLEMQIKHVYLDRLFDRIFVEFYGGALIEFMNRFQRVEVITKVARDINSKMVHLNYEGETYDGISIE